MPDHSARRALYALAVLALVVSILAGCQPAPSRSARASDDWSRGVRLGTASLSHPVAMAVDEEGGETSLLWVAEDDQQRQILRYARLDAAGRTIAEAVVDTPLDRPNQPTLTRDVHGALHATWLARDGDTYRLYHALLDDAGRLTEGPNPLSPPGAPVDSHASVASPEGGMEAFWGAIEGPEPGLYHVRVATNGEIDGAPQPLGVVGFDPVAVRAHDGTLHLVWKEIPESGRQSINYGILDEASQTLVGTQQLAAFGVPTGLISHRPALGIAQGRAYVFWSLERRGGGLAQPSASSQYISFPLGHPEEAGEPREVIIPEENHPSYLQMSTAYRVAHLAPVNDGMTASRFVYLPNAVSREHDQLATAFAVQISGRTKSIVQVVLALWADGQMVGYQIAGQTDSVSLHPQIDADVQGDLYLNWIDTAGFGKYAIYYSATTEEARASLNRLGLDDVAAALFGALWAIAQAASFFPIALVWLFPPVVVLALYAVIRAEDGLDRTGPRIMLVIGVLTYLAAKFLFRPSWLAALPLPRGTPSGLAHALVYLAPVFIAMLAALVTVIYVRRRQYASLLPTFAVFALSDALLTLLVYVPGILAE